MTWNSKKICNWRIVRRIEIVENWIRNVWIQKNSKNDRNSVNNNIFTKFLNNSSKNANIRISFDKNSIDFEKIDLIVVFRKLNAKRLKKKFETTITIIICLIFSLSFSISRCLIWKKRWNSYAFETSADDTKLLIKISLNRLWKTF